MGSESVCTTRGGIDPKDPPIGFNGEEATVLATATATTVTTKTTVATKTTVTTKTTTTTVTTATTITTKTTATTVTTVTTKPTATTVTVMTLLQTTVTAPTLGTHQTGQTTMHPTGPTMTVTNDGDDVETTMTVTNDGDDVETTQCSGSLYGAPNNGIPTCAASALTHTTTMSLSKSYTAQQCFKYAVNNGEHLYLTIQDVCGQVPGSPHVLRVCSWRPDPSSFLCGHLKMQCCRYITQVVHDAPQGLSAEDHSGLSCRDVQMGSDHCATVRGLAADGTSSTYYPISLNRCDDLGAIDPAPRYWETLPCAAPLAFGGPELAGAGAGLGWATKGKRLRYMDIGYLGAGIMLLAVSVWLRRRRKRIALDSEVTERKPLITATANPQGQEGRVVHADDSGSSKNNGTTVHPTTPELEGRRQSQSRSQSQEHDRLISSSTSLLGAFTRTRGQAAPSYGAVQSLQAPQQPFQLAPFPSGLHYNDPTDIADALDCGNYQQHSHDGAADDDSQSVSSSEPDLDGHILLQQLHPYGHHDLYETPLRST